MNKVIEIDYLLNILEQKYKKLEEGYKYADLDERIEILGVRDEIRNIKEFLIKFKRGEINE